MVYMWVFGCRQSGLLRPDLLRASRGRAGTNQGDLSMHREKLLLVLIGTRGLTADFESLNYRSTPPVNLG